MSQLFATLEEHSKRLDRAPMRVKAWERFAQMGLPQRSDEAFNYVPLREFHQSLFAFPEARGMDKALFAHAIAPECLHSHFVFVDGYFSQELSDLSALPPQVLVLSLEEALRTHGQFLQNTFARSIKEEKDPFALLNLSLYPQGAFIYIPPQMALDVPMQCLFVSSSDWPEILSPRIHIALGRHAQAQMLFSSYAKEPLVSHLVTPYTEISLEEGSSLEVTNIVDALAHAWHFETVRAFVKKDARFQSLSFTKGAKSIRQSYRVHLMGENSEADLKGLAILGGNRTAHTHVAMQHEAPFTRSMQRFKGVLRDASRSSFEGKIYVKDIAQKTEAYQINNNLILSPGAVANSKPNLEIFADDVKASHGATIAQIDKDHLFYLTTRGISPETAHEMLVDGFCREMIEQIPYAFLKM